VDKRLRPLWRDRRLYFAIVIALAAFIPIVLWNVSNDFQSFRYYVDRSVATGSYRLQLSPFLNFVLFSILLVSPMICVGFFKGFKRSWPQLKVRSVYPTVAFWVFIISTLVLTGIALISAALYYWNITAYLLLFPLLPAVFEQRAGAIHQESSVAPQETEATQNSTFLTSKSRPFLSREPLFLTAQGYGLLFATLLVVHYSVLPISALFDRETDPDSRMLFGWEQVAAVVKTQAASIGGAPFVATTDYRSASALAYQLNDRAVMAISDRVDQFDFWYTSDASFKGRNAVILWDDWHPASSELLAEFDHASDKMTVAIVRFGVWIKNYYIVKGYGFKGGRVS